MDFPIFEGNATLLSFKEHCIYSVGGLDMWVDGSETRLSVCSKTISNRCYHDWSPDEWSLHKWKPAELDTELVF
jgi:hypothetical protein